MKNKALKRLIYGLTLLLGFTPSLTFAFTTSLKTDTIINNGYKLKTIVIDPGHGGKRTGAAGLFSLEKNVTLAISFKLRDAIEKEIPGINVVMTRTRDTDILWQRRSDIANAAHGDLFISIHCNSLPDRRVRRIVGHHHGHPLYHTEYVPDRSGKGVLLLVYTFRRDNEEGAAIRENLEEDSTYKEDSPDDPAQTILLNAMKAKYRKQSLRIANLINDEFVDVDGRHSDGVKEQSVLVLCHGAMPSVLVETGFINNPDEEKYLNSEDGQNQIVASIVRAIIKYKAEVEHVAPPVQPLSTENR